MLTEEIKLGSTITVTKNAGFQVTLLCSHPGSSAYCDRSWISPYLNPFSIKWNNKSIDLIGILCRVSVKPFSTEPGYNECQQLAVYSNYLTFLMLLYKKT